MFNIYNVCCAIFSSFYTNYFNLSYDLICILTPSCVCFLGGNQLNPLSPYRSFTSVGSNGGNSRTSVEPFFRIVMNMYGSMF